MKNSEQKRLERLLEKSVKNLDCTVRLNDDSFTSFDYYITCRIKINKLEYGFEFSIPDYVLNNDFSDEYIIHMIQSKVNRAFSNLSKYFIETEKD